MWRVEAVMESCPGPGPHQQNDEWGEDSIMERYKVETNQIIKSSFIQP